MFTYILLTLAILLALWLLLHLLSWWLMPNGYRSAAIQLDAQLSGMEASFDAFERELDREFAEHARQERLRRKEERKEALARGEIEPPKPRQLRPKQNASISPAQKQSSKQTAFDRFRQNLETEFAQQASIEAAAQPSQPDALCSLSRRPEVREGSVNTRLPSLPPTHHPPPTTSLFFLPFQKLYAFARRILNFFFRRAA